MLVGWPPGVLAARNYADGPATEQYRRQSGTGAKLHTVTAASRASLRPVPDGIILESLGLGRPDGRLRTLDRRQRADPPILLGRHSTLPAIGRHGSRKPYAWRTGGAHVPRNGASGKKTHLAKKRSGPKPAPNQLLCPKIRRTRTNRWPRCNLRFRWPHHCCRHRTRRPSRHPRGQHPDQCCSWR